MYIFHFATMNASIAFINHTAASNKKNELHLRRNGGAGGSFGIPHLHSPQSGCVPAVEAGDKKKGSPPFLVFKELAFQIYFLFMHALVRVGFQVACSGELSRMTRKANEH